MAMFPSTMTNVDNIQSDPLSAMAAVQVLNNDPLTLMNELPLPWSLSGRNAHSNNTPSSPEVEGSTATARPRTTSSTLTKLSREGKNSGDCSTVSEQSKLAESETQASNLNTRNTFKLADISDWIHLTTIAPMCHDTILEAAVYASKPELNEKIYVCLPEQYPYLEVDCVVYRAPDRTEVSKKLLSVAGPKFMKRLSDKKALKSGEVTIIYEHNLPGAEAIACAPGVDMANPRFINSIDSMVAKVYKNLLAEMMTHMEDREEQQSGGGQKHKGVKKERGKRQLETIAICGLYPLNNEMIDGIHACLRVIRKALEMETFSKLKAIVLCPVADEVSILAETLPYYFPRNRNEEHLGFYLPQLNMTEWGEVAKEEQYHKLAKRPGRCSDFDSLAYELDRKSDSEEAFQAFRWCQEEEKGGGGGGPGKKTSSDSNTASKKLKELQQRVRPYNRLLIEAKKHIYSGKLQKFMLTCGVNKYGVQTVVVIGHYLPYGDPVLMNEAFLFFIDFMDQMANEPFSVIFFCSRSVKIGITNYEWQDMFLSLDEKYGRNLCTLYIVHCTLVGRINTWAMTTFRLSVLKDKIKFANSLLALDELIDISTLPLPTVVYEQEATVQSKNSSPLRNFSSGS